MKTYTPLRMTLLLLLLCVPGVLALLPATAKLVADLPAGAPPLPVMMVITVVQSLVMMGVAALIGSYLAPKVGFSAPGLTGALGQTIRRNGPTAVGIGIIMGTLMVLLDAVIFRPYLPETIYMLGSKPAAFDLIPSLLYGGIAEEVLMRWGVMSLITWVLFRLFQGGEGKAHPAFVWTGIIVASLLFGLLHLPAVQQIVPAVTTGILVRTIVQNGLPALVLGWLFARRGLESAMIMHMGLHIGMFGVRLFFA